MSMLRVDFGWRGRFKITSLGFDKPSQKGFALSAVCSLDSFPFRPPGYFGGKVPKS